MRSYLMIGFLLCNVFAYSATFNISAMADDYFLYGNAGNNGTTDILASEGQLGGNIYGSWLKFDLTSLTGMNIVSATLKLTTVYHHGSGTYYHQVYSASDDTWVETTVSGTNMPTGTYQYISTTLISASTPATISWNVTSALSGSHGLGGSNSLLSLLVRPDTTQPHSEYFGPHFASREYATVSYRPVLVVEAVVPEQNSLFLLFLAGIAGMFCRKLNH